MDYPVLGIGDDSEVFRGDSGVFNGDFVAANDSADTDSGSGNLKIRICQRSSGNEMLKYENHSPAQWAFFVIAQYALLFPANGITYMLTKIDGLLINRPQYLKKRPN